MDPLTPMVIKRKTNARIQASDPHVRQMEQRAHTECMSTYSLDIFRHLVELQESTRMTSELIHSQPQITVAMRPVLFDFLLDVHSRLKLSSASFYLAINVLDRYCSLRIVRKDHFQLLGLSSLWLAAKFLEPKHKIPTLDFLRATCCHCYSKQLFLEMECHILKSLNWEVDAPTHDSLIDLVLKEQNTDCQQPDAVKYIANYICQIMQFHYKCTFSYTVSQIAMASVIIATSTLTLVNENVYIHCGTNNVQLVRLVQLMMNLLRDNEIPNSIKNKFFQKTAEIKVKLHLNYLYQYIDESSRQFNSYYPSTPLSSYYNTPMTSRQSSTSSSSTTADSDVFSRGSTSTLATPPSSCNASPLNHPKTAGDRVPLQQLKLHSAPMHKAYPLVPAGVPAHVMMNGDCDVLERKRSFGA